MSPIAPEASALHAHVPSSEDVRLYECAILYPSPFPQKEEQELFSKIEGFFQEAGAKQIFKDVWGRRGIAYPICGATEVGVVIYYYEIDPAKVREIDQSLKIAKNVLRHLFVKPPKGYKILSWREVYEQWLKERESVEEARAREREEKLQEQVARKARRQVQQQTERKKALPVQAPALEEDVLSKKIEKLISDDTLEI